MTKNILIAAAISGLIGGMSLNAHSADAPKKEEAKGECHGINACKKQGECGGKGHECANANTCKGQGWLSKTEKECKKLKGTFKANNA